MRTDRRGVTLVELLLACSLLSLLSFMFIWFLVPAMRMASLGTARVDIQQMAVLASNRVAADLQLSAPAAVSLFSKAEADPTSAPVVVAMVPLKDLDENGQRVWEQKIVAYFWDRSGKKLLRRSVQAPESDTLSVAPLPTNRPSLLSQADLISLASPTALVRAVASRVVSFDITKVTGGKAFSVEISIEEGVSGKQKAERFVYRKVVSARN